MRNRVRRDNARAGLREQRIRVVGEQAMYGNANGRSCATLADQPDSFDHSSSTGNYIVDKDWSTLIKIVQIPDGYRYITIATADLFKDRKGRVRILCDCRDPLFAFGVRADDQWGRDMLLDPVRYQGRSMNRTGGNTINLTE